MQVVRRDKRRTWGAFSRGHERNGLFGGDYAAGPVVTPVGNNNADLALRFGVYRGRAMPRRVVSAGRVSLWWGRDCAEWFRLSDLECGSLTVGRAALAWDY